MNVTLTPSNYNGNNISCFGAQDGSINVTVSGGIPPYTYNWSNGFTSPNAIELPAGYYRLTVRDAALNSVVKEITLIEPEQLNYELQVYEFPNGYNVSCYNCYNGSATVAVYGGIAPYTVLWDDGNTNINRTGLGAGIIAAEIIDLNGCKAFIERTEISQPERSDWTMNGNTNSNPTNNFIGTKDNQDLIFRTNNLEALRIKSNGMIAINNLAGIGNRVLSVDYLGNIIPLGSYSKPCQTSSIETWFVGGNWFPAQGVSNPLFFGTCTNHDLAIGINGNTNMYITQNKIGVGTTTPSKKFEVASELRVIDANMQNLFDIEVNSSTTQLNSTKTLSINSLSHADIIFDGNMIVNSGKIGVGLTNPLEKMQIGDLWTFHDGGNKVIGYNYHWDSGDKRINNSLPSSGIYFDDNGGIKIKTSSNINNNNIVWLDGIIVDNEGNVGIGGSPSLNSYHKLSVNGFIRSEELKSNNQKDAIVIARYDGTLDVGPQITNDPNKFLNAEGVFSSNVNGWTRNGNIIQADLNAQVSIGVTGIGAYKLLAGYTQLERLDINANSGLNVNLHVNGDACLDGEVGIGCPPEPGYQLVVHGKGGFREIIITNGSGWPDYVFDSSYKLMSLNDLELFIAKNGHLPDISSAKDIDSNSGYNLHTNNVQLLKKIEELTLYIIALNKEIDLLKKLK